jgi:hypothetical protein
MASKKDKQLTGASGEHLVLSRLLSMQILAAPAPRGVRKVDVLINHLDGKSSCLIQVKTINGLNPNSGWPMEPKHEDIKDKDLFYCFVAIKGKENLIYVIPAIKVAKVLKDSHETWVRTPGSKGQKHKQTTNRRFIKNKYGIKVKSAPEGWMDKYLEAWDPITS